MEPDGTVTSFQYEVDNISQEFIMKTNIAPTFPTNFDIPHNASEKFNFKYRFFDLDNSSIRVIKIGGVEDLNPMNYATEISTVLNDPCECKSVVCGNIVQPKRESKIPNIPTMIICQNCDTNFPTKYQYQRHQCEFNADKVVLKPNVDIKDIDKGMRMKFDCPTCGKQFVSKNNLERHQTSHDETNINVCEHCNKQFVSENRLRIHKENHCKKAGDISKFYRSDVTVWKCLSCYQVFATPSSASKHVENCVDNLNRSKSKKGSIEDDDCKIISDEEKCLASTEILDNGITSTGKVNDAITNKNMQKFLTELLLQYVKQEALKDNSMKIIENKEAIVKLIEDVLFAMNVSTENKQNDSNLKETSETTQNSYSQELVIKSEVYSESSSFNKSDTSQDSEKKKRGRKRKSPRQTMKTKRLSVVVENGYKYQCEKCVKVFDSVADLENHREIEHPAKFKCEECGQVVHSAKALLIHSRAHQSLKPYVCEICKRCYSQTSHLWQHMRFHQGIKPFACPHEGCEARYTIRPDLKDHIRKVHTRERPFKCSVCDKCFLTGSVYYQHRLIHTNDRRYGCDICQKRFFRADALNNHRRIHTDERPYPCDICGRQFRQKGDRNKHVRTQHPS
ncbi:Zinc finger, C2H2 type [Popillia japonica]|uniref:Zinc finger, C2H2 type n=1 Tax=Popillia japonica TaxID=7064 RepID=A0AAW1JXK0_POPJA